MKKLKLVYLPYQAHSAGATALGSESTGEWIEKGGRRGIRKRNGWICILSQTRTPPLVVGLDAGKCHPCTVDESDRRNL